MAESDHTSSNEQKAVAKGKGSLAINAAQYANVTVYQYVTYTGDRVTVRETSDPSRCPYPGLETFRTSEAKYFAGREEDIAELEANLREFDVCGVIAASGAGKSSLVHAGLIPALAEREAEAWDIFAFKPGQEPLDGLARSMSGVLAEAETRRGQFDEIDATVADLRETPGRLRRYIEAINSRRVNATDGKHHHILIFIDQWEELYTEENDGDRDILVRELMDVTERGLAKVLLTMRIDFVGDLVTKNTALFDLLEPAVRILRPLSETGCRAAIEKPAEVAGLEVPPELTSRLVADLGQNEGTLPYLQFVLRQLWEKRNKETNSLTTETYDSMDGLNGAIGAHADDVFRMLQKKDPELASLAQQTLPRLANFSETGVITSRRLPFAEFDEPARLLLRKLAEPNKRLIVLSSATEDVAESDIVAELAHEALLGDWKTLAGWIEHRKDFFSLRNKLEADAKVWVNSSRNKDKLILAGKALLEAQELLSIATHNETTPELRSYVKKCVKSNRYRQLSRSVGAFTLFAALSAGVYGWAKFSQQEQSRVADALEQKALEMLRWSNPEASILHGLDAAISAWNVRPSPKAFAMAYASARHLPYASFETLSGYKTFKTTPDGKWLVNATPEKQLQVISVANGSILHSLGEFDDLSEILSVYATKALLLMNDGELVLVEIPSGHIKAKFETLPEHRSFLVSGFQDDVLVEKNDGKLALVNIETGTQQPLEVAQKGLLVQKQREGWFFGDAPRADKKVTFHHGVKSSSVSSFSSAFSETKRRLVCLTSAPTGQI